jgi:hypothetical protein
VPDLHLLDFLADGRTTRAEVLLRLGEPSATFEGERILTYRIGRSREGERWVHARELLAGRPRGSGVVGQESLVLVFAADGRLEKHALVAVQP